MVEYVPPWCVLTLVGDNSFLKELLSGCERQKAVRIIWRALTQNIQLSNQDRECIFLQISQHERFSINHSLWKHQRLCTCTQAQDQCSKCWVHACPQRHGDPSDVVLSVECCGHYHDKWSRQVKSLLLSSTHEIDADRCCRRYCSWIIAAQWNMRFTTAPAYFHYLFITTCYLRN